MDWALEALLLRSRRNQKAIDHFVCFAPFSFDSLGSISEARNTTLLLPAKLDFLPSQLVSNSKGVV